MPVLRRPVAGAALAGLCAALLVGGLALFSAQALPPPGSSIDLAGAGADLAVLGRDPGDQSGIFVETGDVNGDTVADLLVGAFSADGPGSGTGCGSGQVGDRCQAGEAYVIYGSGSPPATVDLSVDDADVTIYGAAASDALGRAVVAGDINGDGTDDLITGAVTADPGGRTDAGAAYVFYGGSLPASIDLATDAADLTVYGRDAGDFASYSVAAGDLNDDTVDDLIVGARLGDGAGAGAGCGAGQVGDRCDAGEAYVIYGGPGLPAVIDLAATDPDVTVFGDDPDGFLSRSLAVADMSGDNVDDLLLGAPQASPAGRLRAGKTYVIHGDTNLPATIDLASTSGDLTILGDDPLDESGWSIAVGDLDDDGTGDLITSAFIAPAPGGGNAGKTYVFFGGPSLTGVIDLSTTAADVTVLGDEADDRSGFAVAAGDIDGDTVDDLGIGALWASPAGRALAGEAYAIYGGSLPATIDLDTTPAGLTLFGALAGDWLGSGAAIGDVNDDGVADLIVGATHANVDGRMNAGATYVVFGGALEPTPTPTPGTPVPTKLPDPGDSDGDGCSDERENGANQQQGGLRNYLNPWDFFDAAGMGGGPPDGYIDLPNDILGVMLRYSANPFLPYEARYDRGLVIGPHSWSKDAPDGTIDLPNDILGVLLQYQHDCR